MKYYKFIFLPTAVLIEKHDVQTSEIISRMSRWFTGAYDRAGGHERNMTKKG